MNMHWSLSLGLLAICISQALALHCFVCDGKGQDHECAQAAVRDNPEQDVSETVHLDATQCPEPSEEGKEKGMRAVCMKVITSYNSYAGKGGVSSRYCDITDKSDSCWAHDGGTTQTEFCACSDGDKCNSAMATATSLVTIFSAILLAYWL